jgi:hypothetical protein
MSLASGSFSSALRLDDHITPSLFVQWDDDNGSLRDSFDNIAQGQWKVDGR